MMNGCEQRALGVHKKYAYFGGKLPQRRVTVAKKQNLRTISLKRAWIGLAGFGKRLQDCLRRRPPMFGGDRSSLEEGCFCHQADAQLVRRGRQRVNAIAQKDRQAKGQAGKGEYHSAKEQAAQKMGHNSDHVAVPAYKGSLAEAKGALHTQPMRAGMSIPDGTRSRSAIVFPVRRWTHPECPGALSTTTMKRC
eukprot:1146760-Pelagomonas_calceolata.AAC.3